MSRHKTASLQATSCVQRPLQMEKPVWLASWAAFRSLFLRCGALRVFRPNFASSGASMKLCIAPGSTACDPTLASTGSDEVMYSCCVCLSLDLGPGAGGMHYSDGSGIRHKLGCMGVKLRCRTHGVAWQGLGGAAEHRAVTRHCYHILTLQGLVFIWLGSRGV